MSKLLVVCGLPYAGKTTLGKALVGRFGHEAVDVDVTKDMLYGLGLKDDDLSRERWVYIYDQTDRQIEDYLRAGKTVVDDSRYFTKDERIRAKAIAARCGADYSTIYVDTPVHVVRQRLAENRKHPARHDVPDEDFEHLLRIWEPPTEDERPLILQHGERLQDWIQANAQELT